MWTTYDKVTLALLTFIAMIALAAHPTIPIAFIAGCALGALSMAFCFK